MSIKPRDELYVTLPSNVPGFTANTPSDYTTILPTPLVLNGNWEVALLETHYFNDWVNFPDTDMVIFLKAKKVVVDESLYSAGRDKRGANEEVVEIPTLSREDAIERANKIDQQIINLEEQIRLLKEKPCPLKQPVKLPPYTTETQLKTHVFFGKMHELDRKSVV